MRIEKRLKIDLVGDEKPELVIEAIYKTLSDNLKEIHDLLFSYHYTKREGVQDIVLEKSNISLDGLKGTLLVLYTIGMSNACADLHHEAKEKMILDLTVDLKSGVLVLRGEEAYEEEQHEI